MPGGFSLKCKFLKFPSRFCARTRPAWGRACQSRTRTCAPGWQPATWDSGIRLKTLRSRDWLPSQETGNRPFSHRAIFHPGQHDPHNCSWAKGICNKNCQDTGLSHGVRPVSVAGPPEDARTKGHRLPVNWLVSKGVTVRAHPPFRNPTPSRSNFQITHIVHLH